MREVELDIRVDKLTPVRADTDRQVSACLRGRECARKPQQANGLRRPARNVEVGVKTLDDLHGVEVLDAGEDFVEHFCHSLGGVVHRPAVAA